MGNLNPPKGYAIGYGPTTVDQFNSQWTTPSILCMHYDCTAREHMIKGRFNNITITFS